MIYSFIITEQKGFIREYHVPSEYSLYDLRRFIDNDLDFDDSQQSTFFSINNNNLEIERYSLFDMDMVTLENLNDKKMTRLVYVFDLFNNRSLSIEFIGETEALPRTSYPLVAASKGNPPGQFFEKPAEDVLPDVSDNYNDDDDDNIEDNFFDDDDL